MTWERTAAAASTAPVEQLWSALLDRNWHDWNGGIAWIQIEGPLAPGTVVTLKPLRAPQTAFRIITVEPPRLLAIGVTFGPLARLEYRWRLTPEGTGSRITQTVAIAGPLAGPLLLRRAEAIAEAAGANLERLAARAAERAGE